MAMQTLMQEDFLSMEEMPCHCVRNVRNFIIIRNFLILIGVRSPLPRPESV